MVLKNRSRSLQSEVGNNSWQKNIDVRSTVDIKFKMGRCLSKDDMGYTGGGGRPQINH